MKVTKSQVEKILLTELDGLDPVTLILNDVAPGQGSIIVTCYGKAWTAFWAGMGDSKVAEFVLSCDEYYLAKNLSSDGSTEIDYGKIGRDIGEDVDITTMAYFDDKLVEVYGPDWRMDLPSKTSDDYLYLCRIIVAMQQGLVTALQQQTTRQNDGH